MARKERLSDEQKRIYAKFEAMQRAKAKRAKEEAAAIAAWKNKPDWIKVGIEMVETMSGVVVVLESIDTTKADGLHFVTKGAPNYTHEWELEELIDCVRRGIDIVRGYTPRELADGFRYSAIDWDNNRIVFGDEPFEFGTDDEVKKRYEKLKPLWL